ncbi:MAG: choice-of-anchor D domain-containing protein [Gaiellales bacterium]
MRRVSFMLVLLALAVAGQTAVAATSGPLTGTDQGFGTVAVGSQNPQTVTISNNDSTATHVVDSLTLGGSDPGQFSLSNDNCSGVTLDAAGGANDHCTVTATFSPGSAGSFSAEIDANYDGGSQNGDVSNLSGTGGTSGVNVSPGSLDFGTQNVSAGPTSLNVTVTNSGTLPVTVASSSITSGSSDFSQNGGCDATVLTSNGDHCQIQVTFNPSTAGNKSGQLQILDTAGSSPENVSLSGTATAPAVSAQNLDFGNVLLGHSATKTLTVSNSGSSALTIAPGGVGLATGGGNYSLSADTCSGQTIAVGNSCTVDVSFHPTLSGAHPGDVSISDNAPGSPQDVSLAGAGLSRFVSIAPASFSFGSMEVGRLGTSHTFTLTNLNSTGLAIGGSPLTIVGINPKSFRVVGDACRNHVIAANHSCTFTVQFAPRGAGALQAQLRETDGAPDSPHTVALAGTGVHPPNITNLHGSVGCNAATVLWKPSTGSGLLTAIIRRSSTRVPRSPLDGTALRRTRVGVLLDGRLHHFHHYYYAIWSEYRFSKAGPIVYSARAAILLSTGEICRPQKHGVVYTTRPPIRWLPVSGAYGYGLRIFSHGVDIRAWSAPTTTPAYDVRSSWVYKHRVRRLKAGETYVLFAYAYTHRRPRGFQIGHSTFTVR